MPSPNNETSDRLNLPVLIATASILQISETLIPHPVPGLRFGFANIISLIILFQYGFKPALVVTLLRTIVSSFVLGNFLSPGFVLSITAGLASICVIGFLNRVFNSSDLFRLSPIGLGMAGAFVHNLVQIILAYLMLIRLPQIFYLIPWLSLGSIALGGFSGWITSEIIKALISGDKMEKIPLQCDQVFEFKPYTHTNSLVHRSKVELKLIVMVSVTILLVIVQDLRLYTIVSGLSLTLIPIARLSIIKTIHMIKKLWVIVLSAFFIPLIFNPGSRVFIEIEFILVHREAVFLGLIFALRIILLALLTSILAQTTRSEELASGIKFFINPLKRIGIDPDHTANLIFESLAYLPQSWHEIRSVIHHSLKGKKTSLKTIKDVVIQVFVYIFSARNNSA